MVRTGAVKGGGPTMRAGCPPDKPEMPRCRPDILCRDSIRPGFVLHHVVETGQKFAVSGHISQSMTALEGSLFGGEPLSIAIEARLSPFVRQDIEKVPRLFLTICFIYIF